VLEAGAGSFWTLTQPATPKKTIEIEMQRYIGISFSVQGKYWNAIYPGPLLISKHIQVILVTML
jgi:hypothetical protein